MSEAHLSIKSQQMKNVVYLNMYLYEDDMVLGLHDQIQLQNTIDKLKMNYR